MNLQDSVFGGWLIELFLNGSHNVIIIYRVFIFIQEWHIIVCGPSSGSFIRLLAETSYISYIQSVVVSVSVYPFFSLFTAVDIIQEESHLILRFKYQFQRWGKCLVIFQPSSSLSETVTVNPAVVDCKHSQTFSLE